MGPRVRRGVRTRSVHGAGAVAAAETMGRARFAPVSAVDEAAGWRRRLEGCGVVSVAMAGTSGPSCGACEDFGMAGQRGAPAGEVLAVEDGEFGGHDAAGADLVPEPSAVMGCEIINPYWGREGQSCPAHRFRPETPAPQGIGAVAAIKRGDRPAISERVLRCRPGDKGSKARRAVQAVGGVLHTSRTGTGARAGPLPQRTRAAAHVPPSSRAPRTCSRSAGTGGASAGVQGGGALFTCSRERGHGRRTRYRGVSRTDAMDRMRDGEWQRGRICGQLCEARCRVRRRQRVHGSRQQRRHARGRPCGCR